MDITHAGVHGESREAESSLRMVLGGSMSEGLAGAGAVALAIIGLANTLSMTMASIATIVVGAGLLFEGAAIATRYSNLLAKAGKGGFATMELGGGMTAEMLGGAAGVALGILALLRVSPVSLEAIAVIVYGGSVIMGSGATARLNRLSIADSGEEERARSLAHAAVSASADAQLMIGMGVVVLGILALLGISSMTLTLVAMLGLGFSILMTGSTLSSRLLGVFRH
jgi:hypothetical protein